MRKLHISLITVLILCSPAAYPRGGGHGGGSHSSSGHNGGSPNSGSHNGGAKNPASHTGSGHESSKRSDSNEGPKNHGHDSHVSGIHTSNYAQGVKRDSEGKIARSEKTKDEFRKSHPCPSTGKSTGACKGYVVDHVTPLKRGGADRPENMQWQSANAAKQKDKTE